MKNNKGFTLIDIILAVVVSSLLSISIVLLMSNIVGLFRDRELESKILLEGHSLSQSLEKSLKSCDEFKYSTDKLCVKVGDKFYYYIFDNSVVYLVIESEEKSSIDYDKSDFLAECIDSFSITPALGNNGVVKYDFKVKSGIIEKDYCSFIRLRNGS